MSEASSLDIHKAEVSKIVFIKEHIGLYKPEQSKQTGI